MLQNQNSQKNKKTINFKYNFKLYFSFVKNYKLILFFILFLILFFQGSQVIERYLFKVLTDDGANFLSNSISKEVFLNSLFILSGVFLGILFFKVIFKWVWLGLINKFDTSLMLDLKKKMFDHIISLDHEFHVSNKTGSLISKLIRGGNAIERLSDVLFFNFIPLFFQIIVVGGSILLFDLTSSLVVIITVIIFIIFSLIVNKRQQKANMAANDAEDYEKAMVADYLTNIDSIKYFGKDRYVKSRYYKQGLFTKDALLYHWNYFRLLSAGHSLIIGLGIFFLLFFSIQSVLSNNMTIGTVIFIYTSFGTMTANLFRFDHGLRGFYRSMADFESLFRYYRTKKTIVDKKDSKKLKILDGSIEFKDVYFKYKHTFVLRGFTLKIPAKKRVAIVGPSGSGKTTLVKLLFRLYDLDKGFIKIDGQDISDVSQESLRSSLSIVPQEAVLFDDSLYNNILFSNMAAKKKDVVSAIKFAQLDKVIKNFPLKENTIVGERGIKLSGGEKQRVSIARAILANKKILVLDEATSALDSKTEHDIQKDLEKLMENRTSIVIAHRLSTILNSDLIVVMDKGKIVQLGTHDELINQKGLYQKLWGLQKGGYID
jgi:ATP-binding cassette subfamily B protein